MTLPKFFSLPSKNFNNFDTMSYEVGTINNTNSSLQEEQQHQQQQLLNPINPLRPATMSALSSISSSINTAEEINTTMYDEANTGPTLQQLQSDNEKLQPYAECVMPGIYLTKDFISWKENQLHANGFTHIIIIDKHVQELYYPNQQTDIFKLCSMENEKTKNLRQYIGRDNSSSLKAFDYYCPTTQPAAKHLSFGKKFDVIDLNFGEKSYLTTVLPNCYKAVKFINKALQAGGTILVIDCNGGEQKCITIIVAYLMYKNNISFSNAFARLKEFYKKADLDRFYKSQLYEYEPILQVQRAQSRGHSCSRDLHAAILKRKKAHDDDVAILDNNNKCPIASSSSSSSACFAYTTNTTATTSATELLNNCNPLNRFDSAQLEGNESKLITNAQNHNPNTFNRFMSATTSSSSSTATATTGGGWYNWDDCAME